LFEEIMGIPAHPLLVHAAVVLVPLQILGALAYGLVPRVRRVTGWFVVLTALAAPAAALVAKLSGDAFRARLVRNGMASPEGLIGIDEHRAFATNVVYASLAVTVLALILVAVHASARRAAAVAATSTDGEGSARGGSPVLSVILVVLVIAASGVAGYYLFQAGDTGANLVWSGM
jgi:hypothetical protein